MQKDPDDPSKLVPAEGYKDVFVSSVQELEKVGVFLRLPNEHKSKTYNKAVKIALKLDLKDEDLLKVKAHGIWLMTIHPGSKLAIPTKRKSEHNPHYLEGGVTASGQREWVTPNVVLEQEVLAGIIHIYKVSTNDETEEWKFWRGRLVTATERLSQIEKHVKKVVKSKI